jgi:hypothetical protein
MELMYWPLYNCLLALLPIALVSMVLWLSNANVSLAHLVRDSQLFFYAASIAAAAIGDLVKRHNQGGGTVQDYFQLWILALMLCIILASFLFGVSAAAKGLSDRRLAWMS